MTRVPYLKSSFSSFRFCKSLDVKTKNRTGRLLSGLLLMRKRVPLYYRKDNLIRTHTQFVKKEDGKNVIRWVLLFNGVKHKTETR